MQINEVRSDPYRSMEITIRSRHWNLARMPLWPRATTESTSCAYETTSGKFLVPIDGSIKFHFLQAFKEVNFLLLTKSDASARNTSCSVVPGIFAFGKPSKPPLT